MKNMIWLALAVLLVSSSLAWAYDYGYDPAKVQFGGHYMELAQDPIPVPGGYEYILDMYICWGMVSGTSTEIWGFDNDKILNFEQDVSWYGSWGGLDDNIIMECWDFYGNEVYEGHPEWFKTPSINDGADGWQLESWPWAMINEWHVPSDYGGGWCAFHTASVVNAGDPYRGGTARDDCIPVNNYWTSTNPAGVLYTVRVVYEDKLSEGDIRWSLWNDPTDNPVLGQWFPAVAPGDFDDNTHVDTLDIDLLCDFIRNAMPYDALYDISGDGVTGVPDGVVNMLDLDYLIRFLVETTVGIGTEYGDFNLDGLVDTTDLTRLATYYGAGDTWAKGNANRYVDLITDTTDLTILATYYGFGGPDAVPEPMTLSLLALGASGLLARRRK